MTRILGALRPPGASVGRNLATEGYWLRPLLYVDFTRDRGKTARDRSVNQLVRSAGAITEAGLQGVGNAGPGQRFGANGYHRFDWSSGEGAPWTVMAVVSFVASTGTSFAATRSISSQSSRYSEMLRFDNLTLSTGPRFGGSTPGGTNWPRISNAVIPGAAVGTSHVIAARMTPITSGSSDIHAWADGSLIGFDNSSHITPSLTLNRLTLGRMEDSSPSASSGQHVVVHAVWVWDSALPENEIQRIMADPWMPLRRKTLTVAPAQLTAVGKEVALRWDDLTVVGDEVQTVWNDLAVVGDQSQAVWDVLGAGVAKQSQLVWDVTVGVGDETQAVWNVTTALGDEAALVWDLRAQVGDEAALIWDLAGSLGDQSDLRWNVTGAVGDEVYARWSVSSDPWPDAVFLWSPGESGGRSKDLVTSVESASALSEGTYYDTDGFPARRYPGSGGSRFTPDTGWTTRTGGFAYMVYVNHMGGTFRSFLGDKDQADRYIEFSISSTTFAGGLRWDTATAGSDAWPRPSVSGSSGYHVFVLNFLEASTLDVELWVDGSLVATDSSTTLGDMDVTALDRLTIGRLDDSTPQVSTDGVVGAAAVWDRSLTSSEIAEIAADPTVYQYVPVGKQVDVQWNLGGPIGDQLEVDWSVGILTVGAEVEAIWDALVTIGDQLAVDWDIDLYRATVDSSLVWHVEGPAGDQVGIVWDTLYFEYVSLPSRTFYPIFSMTVTGAAVEPVVTPVVGTLVVDADSQYRQRIYARKVKRLGN